MESRIALVEGVLVVVSPPNYVRNPRIDIAAAPAHDAKMTSSADKSTPSHKYRQYSCHRPPPIGVGHEI